LAKVAEGAVAWSNLQAHCLPTAVLNIGISDGVILMHIGRVKWFSDKKGYGFITTPDLQGDVFVHFSVIAMHGYKKLKENAEVLFDLELTEKGYMAKCVRRNINTARSV